MNVTILQISDTHFCASPEHLVFGCNPPDRLRAALRSWQDNGERADLILLTGDIADDGSAGAYSAISAVLATLATPILALSGNHDDPQAVRTTFGNASMVELGAWRVVVVDSARPDEVHGTVDVAALCERLDANDNRPTLLAIHHPPRSPSTSPLFQLIGADALLAALAARPHVRVLVSGHLHDPFEYEQPKGLRLIGCPSTVVAIAHDGATYEVVPDAPTGVRVLTLHDDGTCTTSVLMTRH